MPTQQFSIRLPIEVLMKLKAIAQDERRGHCELARMIIEDYIKLDEEREEDE